MSAIDRILDKKFLNARIKSETKEYAMPGHNRNYYYVAYRELNKKRDPVLVFCFETKGKRWFLLQWHDLFNKIRSQGRKDCAENTLSPDSDNDFINDSVNIFLKHVRTREAKRITELEQLGITPSE